MKSVDKKNKTMKQPPRHPIDEHVGARLRMRRLSLSITQEQLAKELGLTFQQVQKYEKGTNRISASRLQQISSILQTTPSFFFQGGPQATPLEGTTEAPSPQYVMDFCSTAEGLALAKAFSSITEPKLRRLIVDLVEALNTRTVEP